MKYKSIVPEVAMCSICQSRASFEGSQNYSKQLIDKKLLTYWLLVTPSVNVRVEGSGRLLIQALIANILIQSILIRGVVGCGSG